MRSMSPDERPLSRNSDLPNNGVVLRGLTPINIIYGQDYFNPGGDVGEVIRARKPKRLPVIMTYGKVKSVFGHPK